MLLLLIYNPNSVYIRKVNIFIGDQHSTNNDMEEYNHCDDCFFFHLLMTIVVFKYTCAMIPATASIVLVHTIFSPYKSTAQPEM
jgi:hypothetical protein